MPDQPDRFHQPCMYVHIRSHIQYIVPMHTTTSKCYSAGRADAVAHGIGAIGQL